MAFKIAVSGQVTNATWLTGVQDHRVNGLQTRRLRIFAIDPSIAARDGAVAEVTIPYEPLTAEGPQGRLFKIDMEAPEADTIYQGAELDHPTQLADLGYPADAADPRFHAQMVYAVCVHLRSHFCRALGRTIGWAAPIKGPLTLKPFAMQDQNAFYDRQSGEIAFGYFTGNSGAPFPVGTYFFTSLSSDVISHEVSHALLDSVRPSFLLSVGPDVAAFHESFADLMALFQRFEHMGFVRAIFGNMASSLSKTKILSRLAPEFGQAAGLGNALRSFSAQAADPEPGAIINEAPLQYRDAPVDMPHERGRVLTEAIFEAFANSVERHIVTLLRIPELASVFDAQRPSQELVGQISAIATKIASHYRSMCIRALDYCPPTNIEFGDYLRALITADRLLAPDDARDYRESLVIAFRRRGLFPRHVNVISQTSLTWSPPRTDTRVEGLAFEHMAFELDPAAPADDQEALRRAQCLAEALQADPAFAKEAGLVLETHDSRLRLDPPEVRSIECFRQIGPQGAVHEGSVAQVVQNRWIKLSNGADLPVEGGATLHFSTDGKLALSIVTRVDNNRVAAEAASWADGAGGRDWTDRGDKRLGPNMGRQRIRCQIS